MRLIFEDPLAQQALISRIAHNCKFGYFTLDNKLFVDHFYDFPTGWLTETEDWRDCWPWPYGLYAWFVLTKWVANWVCQGLKSHLITSRVTVSMSLSCGPTKMHIGQTTAMCCASRTMKIIQTWVSGRGSMTIGVVEKGGGIRTGRGGGAKKGKYQKKQYVICCIRKARMQYPLTERR